MGVEKLADNVPDLKESFDIGDDEDPVFRNRWPARSNCLCSGKRC
jgi:hypothetical protein